MEEAFVIMQINNTELDLLWRDVYRPAIMGCGLDPKRVDKHNEGHLLSSEIADFIKRSKIIIADLTNERQNCYLEVGYAMGIGQFTNLILCAREDHNLESPNYTKGDPKIHFDLSGYGFIWWHKDKLEDFKKELISKIKQRLYVLENDDSISNNGPKVYFSRATKNRYSLGEIYNIGNEDIVDLKITLKYIDKSGQPLTKNVTMFIDESDNPVLAEWKTCNILKQGETKFIDFPSTQTKVLVQIRGSGAQSNKLLKQDIDIDSL